MKLYAFDGIDENLDLLPLAARRALDVSGKKLSLAGFRSLTLEDRRALTEAGGGERVDPAAVGRIIAPASPPALDMPALPEPGIEEVPGRITETLGSERPLPDKVWSSLSALDRYALYKVTEKPRTDRVAAAYAELVGSTSLSTHLTPSGEVRMVSVATKAATERYAMAESWVQMSADAFARLRAQEGPKGDVLNTARLAGIMATKRTSDLIPLCHPLALSHAEVTFEEDAANCRVRVLCSATVVAPTGVEMEAMVGAQVATLTIYDMLKSVDRGMSLGPTRLLEKRGGRSGSFSHSSAEEEGDP